MLLTQDEDFGLDAGAIARAEAALDALSKTYITWAEADLEKMRASLSRGDWVELHAVAHNVKGQAGTFGYPLLTELGARLCALVREHEAPDRARAESLVEAIALVVGQRISGDGGDRRQEVLARIG